MTCTDCDGSPGASLYSTLIAGATNLVRLVGLYDEQSHSYPTTATVTVTIRDLAGNIITGASGLVALLDGTTSGVDTEYRAVVPDTAALDPGEYVIVSAVAVVSLTTRTFTLKVLVS